jgi:hypothetical protein
MGFAASPPLPSPPLLLPAVSFPTSHFWSVLITGECCCLTVSTGTAQTQWLHGWKGGGIPAVHRRGGGGGGSMEFLSLASVCMEVKLLASDSLCFKLK